MKAITFRPFSSASRRMRWPISADCAGDPPGELIASAIALAPRVSKARLSNGETDSTDRLRPLKRPLEAMTPDRRTTGTTGPRRKRSFNQPSMAGTVAAPASEGKRRGVTQDRLGRVGVAALRPVQHQRRRFDALQGGGAAGSYQYTRRWRQALEGDVAPAQPDQMSNDLLQPVAALNDEHGACRFCRPRRHREPAR